MGAGLFMVKAKGARPRGGSGYGPILYHAARSTRDQLGYQ